jgi:hypothetical protein
MNIVIDRGLLGDALALDIPKFSERMLDGLNQWEAAEGNDPAVVASSERLVRLHANGLPRT